MGSAVWDMLRLGLCLSSGFLRYMAAALIAVFVERSWHWEDLDVSAGSRQCGVLHFVSLWEGRCGVE